MIIMVLDTKYHDIRKTSLYHEQEKAFTQTFLQREYQSVHLEYDKEMDFYEAVKTGNIDKLEQIMLPLHNENWENCRIIC